MMQDHTPRRIASLQPSATVILAELGELDRVVACTKYCHEVVSEILERPRTILSDSWTANAEQILAQHPELVIAAVPYQEKAVVEILKSGVRFLGLAPKSLADIYTDIATIAGAVGACHKGEAVISRMRARIEEFALPYPWASAPESVLRRVGQAVNCFAVLGRGVGGSRWRKVCGNSRRKDFRRGGPRFKSRCNRRGLVRSWRPRTAGKNHGRAKLAGNSCGP